MSSPLGNLKKGKKTPIGSRQAPYKPTELKEKELISKVLSEETSQKRCCKGAGNVTISNHDLMSSMVTRLASLEKQLVYFEELNKEKDKRIKILDEKCEIYKKAQGYGTHQVIELEKKCHKLQRQVHSMESFLEDYGMMWIGTNNSSDEDNDDDYGDDGDDELCDDETNVLSTDNSLTNCQRLWKPDSSFSKKQAFVMDYDLVLHNIEELNNIAGEGEHVIQHTKDGARLQVKEAVNLVLYANGIFMFNGPFRSFEDEMTQVCIQDIMDGYFPSELQQRYPDGIPFKVRDKRDTSFKDKRMDKLFPGEGYSLSPEKNSATTSDTPVYDTSMPHTYRPDLKTESSQNNANPVSMDVFLSSISSSVVKNGKIIDIREGLREVLQEKPCKNDVIVIETEVVKDMKTRLSSGRKSRSQTPCNVTTLRIKSEAGNQTYVMKMLYTQTIADVQKHLDCFRDAAKPGYDLKTSFPNQTYSDTTKTLRESGLVPNATLHMISRK